MSTTFETSLLTMYAALPTARAQVRYKDSTIEKALSSGVEKAHEETDEGNYPQADVAVRYITSSEPEAWGGKEMLGKVVELEIGGAWGSYSVVGYRVSGGIAILTGISEYGTT